MRKHRILSLLPLIGLLSVSVAAPIPVFAEQPPVPAVGRPIQPAIVSTGSGEVNITPNIAHITLGVETRDTDSSKATALNAGKMEQVTKAVRAFDIPDKDIQTVNYSMYQANEPGPNGKAGRSYFVVNNSVRVTIRKLADVGKILDGLTALGANTAGGIQFDADDEIKDRAYDEALTKATGAALRKARTMAKASGSSLSALLELTESGAEYNPPRPYMTMAKADGVSTPISGGELTVRATVTARYLITDTTNIGTQ